MNASVTTLLLWLAISSYMNCAALWKMFPNMRLSMSSSLQSGSFTFATYWKKNCSGHLIYLLTAEGDMLFMPSSTLMTFWSLQMLLLFIGVVAFDADRLACFICWLPSTMSWSMKRLISPVCPFSVASLYIMVTFPALCMRRWK